MNYTEHQKAPSSQNYHNRHQMIDEINLLDILKIFVKQKWIIISTTFFCTIIAIATALLLPPEYRSELTIMPPLAETVEKLNIPNITTHEEKVEEYFFKVDPQDLYTELILNLQSNRLRRQFFDHNNLIQHLTNKDDNKSVDTIFQHNFSDKITIKGITKKNENKEFIVIRLDGDNPTQIANWLNSFVKLADQETILGETRSLISKIQMVRSSISKKIESLRATEKSRRLDTIARLQEAVIIAKKLTWTDQPENLNVLYEQVITKGMNLSFSLQDMPLYLRGSKALQAEISVLSNRKNDDPFIPELRSLQEELNYLSSITQGTDNIHAMRLDQAAIANDQPIKPKRKLIVIIGLILGLLLSLSIALLRNAYIRYSK